ncbi:MAG: hypothetical protein MSA20_07975, partial [Bacteroidales bacterium]|nr:hypothetical protein [Bacteroidales bacterium]
ACCCRSASSHAANDDDSHVLVCFLGLVILIIPSRLMPSIKSADCPFFRVFPTSKACPVFAVSEQ